MNAVGKLALKVGIYLGAVSENRNAAKLRIGRRYQHI